MVISSAIECVGARATHGVKSGKYFFECTFEANEKAEFFTSTRQIARVGWSTRYGSRELCDEWGFGFVDTGKKSHAGRFEHYGPSFGNGDVIGCLIDRDNCEISFVKNGTYLGVAFIIPLSLDNRALFPTCTLMNITAVVNFGSSAFRHPVPLLPHLYSHMESGLREAKHIIRFEAEDRDRWRSVTGSGDPIIWQNDEPSQAGKEVSGFFNLQGSRSANVDVFPSINPALVEGIYVITSSIDVIEVENIQGELDVLKEKGRAVGQRDACDLRRQVADHRDACDPSASLRLNGAAGGEKVAITKPSPTPPPGQQGLDTRSKRRKARKAKALTRRSAGYLGPNGADGNTHPAQQMEDPRVRNQVRECAPRPRVMQILAGRVKCNSQQPACADAD